MAPQQGAIDALEQPHLHHTPPTTAPPAQPTHQQ
jgi:hypothetical protein